MQQSKQDETGALSMIRDAGLRVTKARVRVLSTLLLTKHALSHHDIEKAVAVNDDTIERVTIYRTLDWLVNQGLAHKITGADRVWRFNAQVHPVPQHVHFTCTQCGRVFCLENLRPTFTGTLPPGFHLTKLDLSLEGICSHCSH